MEDLSVRLSTLIASIGLIVHHGPTGGLDGLFNFVVGLPLYGFLSRFKWLKLLGYFRDALSTADCGVASFLGWCVLWCSRPSCLCFLLFWMFMFLPQMAILVDLDVLLVLGFCFFLSYGHMTPWQWL